MYKITLEGHPFKNESLSFEAAVSLVARYRTLFPALDFRIIPV